jgi:ankyrin repeat protein
LNPPLILAAGRGFTKIVRNLVERGANRDAKNDWAYTALMMAARSIDLVTLLIEADADG